MAPKIRTVPASEIAANGGRLDAKSYVGKKPRQTPSEPAVPDFDAYRVGIVAASVCTSLSDAEATVRLNAEHPTGIRSAWRVSTDKTFKTGEPNPCECNRHPATHRHILFSC